ncbi:MAG: hypothetical protein GTO18_14405 [Anaerolineales bacterium]|nr:hypothetical protein [Anaerolineales bacterium]
MSIDFRADYNELEEMKQIFADSARQLEDLNSQVKQWATLLHDGALLGDAGEALADAFGSRLSSKVMLLSERLADCGNEIGKVIAIYRDGERDVASRFG